MIRSKLIAKFNKNLLFVKRCTNKHFLSTSNKKSENLVWKEINWKKIETRLKNLQYKIYAAKRIANNAKISIVRKYQKTILNSRDFKLLAVRKVTQLNRGKKTAGIDGIKNLTEKQRIDLANNLRITGKAKPVRRVMIPKPNGGFRPLGIPTMYDRALQSLFVMALEPEFEAIFEENSYGSRPGRSAIDALKQIQLCCQHAEKFVLDADIAKCFDRIDHVKLLEVLGHRGKIRTQIEAWLKSGNIFEGTFEVSETGTPQGGVISSLLSNIALHGLEKVIGDWAENQRLLRRDGKPLDRKSARRKAVHVIRYVDDFVIMHRELWVIKECQKLVSNFLAERGLAFNEVKTKIVHTRLKFNNNPAGFEFLGFKVKHFSTKKHSAKDNQGNQIGYRLIIFPTMKSRKKHFRSIDKIIRKYKTAKQSYIIKKLNPIVTGWTNYFRFSHFLTTKIGGSMEHILYQKLVYWARRKLNTKNIASGYKKFWHKVDGRRQFSYKACNGENVTLALYRKVAKGYSLVKYSKVKGDVSVYNGDLIYWSKRAIIPELRTSKRVKLLRKQAYKCNICSKLFLPGDITEIDHIKPVSEGGSQKIANLQMLHAVCHDYKNNKVK